ncbi:MAG: hypothetical protein HKM89_05915 [Gemmatimonadales bacterium]|nr:hypothetical protein [Gemmatimonadales bacterium]
MFCIPNGLTSASKAIRVVVLTLLCVALGTPQGLRAQANGPDASRVLRRLGIPATTLATIPQHGVKVECRPGAGASVCELRFRTDSDQVCRAVAIREGLRHKRVLVQAGDSQAVVARATCGSGIVAVFQAGSRRGIMSYKDARGNTARREFPL